MSRSNASILLAFCGLVWSGFLQPAQAQMIHSSVPFQNLWIELLREQLDWLVASRPQLVCKLWRRRSTAASIRRSRSQRRPVGRIRVFRRGSLGESRLPLCPRQQPIDHQHHTVVDHDGRIPRKHQFRGGAPVCDRIHAGRRWLRRGNRTAANRDRNRGTNWPTAVVRASSIASRAQQ